ncbi:MAG: hypothetical protein JWP97_3039 [Labilithrix sp.]|nr:hypothetical protein [Labilithrix sp.]
MGSGSSGGGHGGQPRAPPSPARAGRLPAVVPRVHRRAAVHAVPRPRADVSSDSEVTNRNDVRDPNDGWSGRPSAIHAVPRAAPLPSAEDRKKGRRPWGQGGQRKQRPWSRGSTARVTFTGPRATPARGCPPCPRSRRCPRCPQATSRRQFRFGSDKPSTSGIRTMCGQAAYRQSAPVAAVRAYRLPKIEKVVVSPKGKVGSGSSGGGNGPQSRAVFARPRHTFAVALRVHRRAAVPLSPGQEPTSVPIRNSKLVRDPNDIFTKIICAGSLIERAADLGCLDG